MARSARRAVLLLAAIGAFPVAVLLGAIAGALEWTAHMVGAFKRTWRE